MGVTIHDVAREAGVGIGTVSRVLNQSPLVKESTRSHVLETIARMNYRPDPIAQSMGSRRCRTLVIMVPFFEHIFSLEVIRGIEAVARREGQDLLIYNLETKSQLEKYFALLSPPRKIDGLILLSVSLPETMAIRLKETGLPIILLNSYSPHLTSLTVNYGEGAYQATRLLLQKGHRRIGFINGYIEGNLSFNRANEYLIGIECALDEAGILFTTSLVATTLWSYQGGLSAARYFLNLKEAPTAILTVSDIQALGVLEAARVVGREVPSDLSLISFEDSELSRMLEITNMQIVWQQLGEMSVYKLLSLIEGKKIESECIQLNTTIIERQTSGAVVRAR